MKRIFICAIVTMLLLIGANSKISAQGVEAKLNVPFALFGVVQASVEFPVGNDFGVEPEIIFGEGGGGVLLHGKYYFRPDYGNDKVYIGLITGGLFAVGESALVFGFEGGYKWVGKRNILFEIGGGIGRGTGEIDVVPYLRLMVGYRFKKKAKD